VSDHRWLEVEQVSVYDIDFGDVRGQESAKRAMTLAAAGRHNLIRLWPV
jgi:magnesium chelatase family protein